LIGHADRCGSWTRGIVRRDPPRKAGPLLSTIAILIAGCLIDGALILLLARLTDGRPSAAALYGARVAPVVRSLH